MQTSTQTPKPFYKKVWFYLVAVFLLLAAFGKFYVEPQRAEQDKLRAEKHIQDSIQDFKNRMVDLKRQGEQADSERVAKKEMIHSLVVMYLKDFEKPFDNTPYQGSIELVQAEIEKFRDIAKAINDAKDRGDSATNILAQQLKQKLIALQKKEFPIMRKRYAEAASQKVWENDVYISASGTGNTTMNLTAGMFAANKNIQEAQNTMGDMLTKFRFKSTHYRWYKDQDEWTGYTMETPKDDELIEVLFQ